MDETRRERKKRQTRRLLVETALRLFDEQGYDRTTITQIAEAADVATKTFFNYFPTKEDVVFADRMDSYRLPLEIIADRRPGEPLADLLQRVFDEVIQDYEVHGAGLDDPQLAALYARLLLKVPSLQARALHLMFAQQRAMAEALTKAFPDELDPITAASVVGCLMGSAQAAGLASLEAGHGRDEMMAAVRTGIRTAMEGIRSVRDDRC